MGVRSEKVGGGRAAQIGCLFGLSGLSMTLFYLKLGLDISRVFAKYFIFD